MYRCNVELTLLHAARANVRYGVGREQAALLGERERAIEAVVVGPQSEAHRDADVALTVEGAEAEEVYRDLRRAPVA